MTIFIPATKKHRLSGNYGGIAFYNGYPHLVSRYRDGAETSRPVYRWDESLFLAFRLTDTDTAIYETTIEHLSLSSGTWRTVQLYVPPQIVSIAPNRLVDIAYMGVYSLDGTYDTKLRMAYSQQRYTLPYDQTPYDTLLPGLADRLISGDHDTFWSTARNQIVAWRTGMQWVNLPRTDPIWVGQFAVTTEPERPLAFDGDYLLVTVKQSGVVTWYDVSAWDTVGQTLVSMVPYKSVGLYDAQSGIQDITIDETNNRLWVLTTNKELQRYDLDAYVGGIKQNNPCKAIMALNPPASMTHNSSRTLTFELVDMWGVQTSRSTSVEFICTATESNQFYGDLDGSQRITKTSSTGLISVVYRNKNTDTPTSGNETIIARVI